MTAFPVSVSCFLAGCSRLQLFDPFRKLMERFVDLLLGRILAGQDTEDLHQLPVKFALDLLADAQKLDIAVTILVYVHNIGKFVLISIIQIKVELVISRQIQREKIRKSGPVSVYQSSFRLPVRVKIESDLVTADFFDLDLIDINRLRKSLQIESKSSGHTA